jgi:hypothetical protein
LPTFLHVDDNAGQPDPEHPTQGALPDLKLVAQPPAQLPLVFARLASCVVGDIANGVGVVGDVRGDTVLRATARCFCGLATCFGASTTTLGSEVVALPEGAAACDIVMPLRPHGSSAIDKMETARLATKSEESLIATSSQMRGKPIPGTQDITLRCELGHCQF